MSSSYSMFQFTLQIYLINLSQVHITTLQKNFEAVRVYNFVFNFINSSISNDCEPTYRYNSREISVPNDRLTFRGLVINTDHEGK